VFVTKDIRSQFGKKVRLLRKKHGWTLAEMAHRLGVDRSYLNEIELGQRNVCLLNLKVIADGLNISLSQLFSRI
jgi:transcriptional regulator with XRE-family HTH domain